MQIIDRIVTLRSVMDRELSLIREFSEKYDELRAAVQGKKWQTLQSILRESGRISREVAACEERRFSVCSELYVAFSLKEDRNFFELAAFFPEDLKEEIKGRYLQLRVEVYRMKCRLKSLEAYSRVRVQLVDEVINKAHALQSSGGSPYKRAGRRAMHDPDSFLFDWVK